MAFPPPNNGNAPPRQSLPIPSAGQWSGLSSMSGDTSGRSFPRQSSFQAPVRWPSMNANANTNPNATGGSSSRAGIANGYNEVMPSIETSFAQGTNIPNHNHNSVASNPHSGIHPASFGPNYHFVNGQLGSSSIGSSSLGMSMSPPRWGNVGQGWGGPGSFVGSLGAMGSSFGRDRDREMEARYVRDFSCCGKQLGGLHELLEHYEEDHANLAPEVKMAAINAAHTAVGRPAPPAHSNSSMGMGIGHTSTGVNASDVPTPPGMMDIEMDEPGPAPTPASLLGVQPQFSTRLPNSSTSNALPNPWVAAFRSQNTGTPPQGVPPSLLSFSPSAMQDQSRPAQALTAEQQAAKAMRKAQRKAEKAAAREEATGSDAEGDKRFPCPIEGCGKVYKQANGLKYHLTRSINSGHGNMGLGGDRPMEGS